MQRLDSLATFYRKQGGIVKNGDAYFKHFGTIINQHSQANLIAKSLFVAVCSIQFGVETAGGCQSVCSICDSLKINVEQL